MEIIPQLIVNSIIAASLYSLIALGFTLIFGAAKFFDIGYGALTAVGGYAVFFLAKKLGVSPWAGIPLAVVFAGLLGYFLYKVIYEPMKRKKASSMTLLVASLGVLTVLQAIMAMLFTSQFQTLSQGATRQKIYEIFGGVITQTQVIIFITVFAALTLLAVLLYKTKFGRAVRALSDNESLAEICGVNASRLIGYIFFLASAVAAIAGVAIGYDTGIEPIMGMGLLFKGMTAAVIGGLGNVYGSVLGAFFLGFAENFGIWKISGEWKDAMAFVLLIAFLLFRPRGIFSR